MVPGEVKVYLAIKPVDMRRSFDGLSILIQTEFKKDVMTGSLFVFCNKNRDRIKLFYWAIVSDPCRIQ